MKRFRTLVKHNLKKIDELKLNNIDNLKGIICDLYVSLNKELSKKYSEDIQEISYEITKILNDRQNEWLHLFKDPGTSKSQIDEIQTILQKKMGFGGDHMFISGIAFVIMNSMDKFKEIDRDTFNTFEFGTKVIQKLHPKRAGELTKEHFTIDNIKQDVMNFALKANPYIRDPEKIEDYIAEYIASMGQYRPPVNTKTNLALTGGTCTWETYYENYHKLFNPTLTLDEAIDHLIAIASGKVTNDNIP